jgi:hypothetical protein
MTGLARPMVAPDETGPTTLDEARTQLSADAQWAVEWFEQLGNTALLADGLRMGRTIAAADGSFKDRRGTLGFALVHEPSGQRINGANQVPGEATDQAAYWSELAGIYGTLILVQMLCRIHGIEAGHLIIACDNLAAGQKGIEWEYPPKPPDDHFDMLAAIHSLRNVLPITTEFRHVEAHQREKHRTRSLDKWAIWNDEMDALAKAFWAFTTDAAAPTSAPVYGKEWSVWVYGRKVCKQFCDTIREAVHTDRLTSNMVVEDKRDQAKAKFTPHQIQAMDTIAPKAAWSNATTARRRWICKNAADLIPVGRNMKRWQFSKKNNCPRCLHEDETTAHVQQCQDPRAVIHRNFALSTFN